MKVIEFKEQNVIFAKDQKEYLQLPAKRFRDGRIIFCWEVGFIDRVKVLFTGKIWHQVLTFNEPLQPQKLDAHKPDMS